MFFSLLSLQSLRCKKTLKTHTRTDATLPQAASKFVDEQMEAEQELPLEGPCVPDNVPAGPRINRRLPTTPHMSLRESDAL